MAVVDRPLALGELLAETARVYGDRFWAALGLGGVVAAMILLGVLTGNVLVYVLVLSVAFTGAYAAAARLVAGDGFGEAWAQVAVRAPSLLVLTLVVAVPFTVGRIDPIILLFAVAWLGLVGFSIPVIVLERAPEATGFLARLAYALRRSLVLARAEYLHAVGVAAALVIVYLLLGRLLVAALAGFAESGGVGADLLVQAVLAPFFFIGLSVLYFEQNARALSSRRKRER